jgi:hypothetical protein
MGMDPDDVVITVMGANAVSGQPATVTLSYQIRLGALRAVLPREHIQLTATSVMIHE